MFDQWKPALDFIHGAPNHSPYPQANQFGADQFSIENFLDHNPMMSPLLLLPMKPQNVDSPSSSLSQIRVVSGQAFTSDVTLHQPFNPSFQPLEPADCHPYSPASSPDGSCSDLFGAPKPQFLYSSPSNTDHSEALSDIGCGTAIKPTHPQIFPDNCSAASENVFSHHTPAVMMPDAVPRNSSVPEFCGLSQSRAVVPYPSEIFPATGTTGVSVSPISLMANIFPIESSGYLCQSRRSHDRFPRTWPNEHDNCDRDRGHLNGIQASGSHSGYDTSNERHHFSGNAPITKMKRFPCPECGQRFARAFNLQTHIATHAGMRPFSCPADGCTKAFSRRHDLGRHVGAVHRDWLALQKISVQEAVKPLRWKNDAHKRQNHHACRNQAKQEN